MLRYDPVTTWRDELLEAGWRPYRSSSTIWEAPNGTLHLGPYGAWRAMKAQGQGQNDASKEPPTCR